MHDPDALRQIRSPEAGVALGHGRIRRPAHDAIDLLEAEHPLPIRITKLKPSTGSLVPQVMRVFEACMKLPAFEDTRPEKCPDFE